MNNPKFSTLRKMGVSRVLVTGGAGFIGSHLVDRLMDQRFTVSILDNLSNGKRANLSRWTDDSRLKFTRGDLLNEKIAELAIRDCEAVFHFAANPNVRIGSRDTAVDYRQNILATYKVLELMRRTKNCKSIIFASTSTIYGEATEIPTPEEYGPLKPISLYGASKLCCESLISGYCHMFGISGIILRFANIIGARSNHGVIYDFMRKLKKNSRMLEILGNGRQNKSYLYIDDCIDAVALSTNHLRSGVSIYNVGSMDRVNVNTIAKIVAIQMGIKGFRVVHTPGFDGQRGWKGDITDMLLDVSSLRKLGWKPRYNSRDSVGVATKSLLDENGLV